jgi:hypothetical protein
MLFDNIDTISWSFRRIKITFVTIVAVFLALFVEQGNVCAEEYPEAAGYSVITVSGGKIMFQIEQGNFNTPGMSTAIFQVQGAS